MDTNGEQTPLTATEGEALVRRVELGAQIELTDAERAYLKAELSRKRQEVKDIIIDQLMLANKVGQDARAEEARERMAGLTDDDNADIWDALDRIVTETAVYVSTMDETLVDDLASFENIHAHLAALASKTADFYEYEGYRLLMNFFAPREDSAA